MSAETPPIVNGWVIPHGAVVAIGRFEADGPTGYRAQWPYVVDAPIRATRAEAFQDIVAELTGEKS